MFFLKTNQIKVWQTIPIIISKVIQFFLLGINFTLSSMFLYKTNICEMASNCLNGGQQYSVNWRQKSNKEYMVSAYNGHSQNRLNVPQELNSYHNSYTPIHSHFPKEHSSAKKYGTDSRKSKTSSLYFIQREKHALKPYSQSNEDQTSQKNLKLKQLTQQIDKKLSELSLTQYKQESKLFQKFNIEKQITEIKTLLNSIKQTDESEYLNRQLAKTKQQIKLLEAENNQLKTKLQKNVFLQKKQLRDFVTKDKYEKLKERLQDVLNRNKRNSQMQSEHDEEIESYIERNIQRGNKELEIQDQATIIAQEVAKIYFELDRIIKDNNLSDIFYPKQLQEISKKIQLLLDHNTYEKILQKIKLTSIFQMIPELTQARQAQIHFRYQEIIEKLINETQKIKNKYQHDFETVMQKITQLNFLKISQNNFSKRRSSLDKNGLKTRSSTVEENKHQTDEKSNNSQNISVYVEKIKNLEQDYEKLIQKNQDLEVQLEQKSENSQSSYIYELIYDIACFLPLQDTQATLFRPQSDADCVSMLYQIRFFAKKFEEKQKQQDKKMQQFQIRIVSLLKKVIQHYNIPKLEIMQQINTWPFVGNIRNLIHNYYYNKQSPEKIRTVKFAEMPLYKESVHEK